jgi:hypothetical protein
MSTPHAAPASAGMRRTVVIDFLFRDLSGCRRCAASGANVETALAAMEPVLSATGARVELRKTRVQSVEQARQLRLLSLPTIRVNGHDVSPELLESECGATDRGCGPAASCRAWRYAGREHAEAPVGLVVDAVLSALYAQPTRTEGGCCA